MKNVDVWELPPVGQTPTETAKPDLGTGNISNVGTILQMAEFVCNECGAVEDAPAHSGPVKCQTCHKGWAVELPETRRAA